MIGCIVGVYGNMVVAEVDGAVVQNSVARCFRSDGARLVSEVVRVRGRRAEIQVFEETRGLRIGDQVEFSEEMLSLTLGPGLLGQIFDGLQNPLPRLAEASGYFLTPGLSMPALPRDRDWLFTPAVEAGAVVRAGDALGHVPEGVVDHAVMVPFGLHGRLEVVEIAAPGSYRVPDAVALLTDARGDEHPVTLEQRWPVKVPLAVARERLVPSDPLVTQVRIIDSLFPVARGGTYCIPGPFGAGKTVLQQITSRYAEVDVVIVAACGERAGEVVETIREFPELEDPRTGRSLMERTIIVCNTSAMPVAAREASVYTAVTLGEYYRQMGLHVLLLADSISRWAQALRELSGRLEEIPGEEAFPAYLESRIAAFFERAGVLDLRDGRQGSLTIGATVSPAGGNFEEPVTQAALKVVGAFHGLSNARAHARRYPAIDPLESWSRYRGVIPFEKVTRARSLLRRGDEIRKMMTVVGEEGVAVEDFTLALTAELVDACYLQQNALDAVDGATSADRQRIVFDKVLEVVGLEFGFESREEARSSLLVATDLFRTWNYAPFGSGEFRKAAGAIDDFIEGRGRALGAPSTPSAPGVPTGTAVLAGASPS